MKVLENQNKIIFEEQERTLLGSAESIPLSEAPDYFQDANCSLVGTSNEIVRRMSQIVGDLLGEIEDCDDVEEVRRTITPHEALDLADRLYEFVARSDLTEDLGDVVIAQTDNLDQIRSGFGW
jgi:hypothetical protein